MGNIFYYRDYDHELGDMSKGRWREVRKLLPLLIDYVNNLSRVDWSGGQFRNVVVHQGETVPHIGAGSSAAPPPSGGVFALNEILRDDAETLDEIVVLDGKEMLRLLAWCEFLQHRDGAYVFYDPVVRTLKEKMTNLSQYLLRDN